MNRVYLDYNATTPVDPAVLDAMLPYFTANFANASSIHTPGQRARNAVETAREQVAALIGANPKEVVFTSGGTESDNHAIFGILSPAFSRPSALVGAQLYPQVRRDAAPLPPIPSAPPETVSPEERGSRLQPRHSAMSTPGALAPDGSLAPHIITTATEHEAVLNACQQAEKRGAQVTYLSVDKNGQIDLQQLKSAIRPETILITVMHANNELGTIQPLEEIGKIAKEADIYFHTDAVQSTGKIPVDVTALAVDLLSLSGHKIYAPKGIGALYIKGGTHLQQLLYGGHHQRGARPGTENVAGIAGLGAAAAIAKKAQAADAERISKFRDHLERELLRIVPDAKINGANAARLPNTSNITFPGLEGEALLISLDLKGLAISTGAACSSGAVEPSHVLTAIGLSPEDARASLRFSLGRQTTREEIDQALTIIPAAVLQLRQLSPTNQ
jgi:cysteine desulfurase